MNIQAAIREEVENILREKNPGGVTVEQVSSIVEETLQKQPPKGIEERQVLEIVGREIKKLTDQEIVVMSDFRELGESLAKQVSEATEQLKGTGKEVVIIPPDNNIPIEELPSLGVQHHNFGDLVHLIQARQPTYIYGPTGGGKTSALKLICEQLGLTFHRKVVNRMTTPSELFGFANVNGELVEGIALKAWRDGGVLLIDEFDNGNPNVNAATKMMADVNVCNFPVVGNVPRHKDFVMVAGANTGGAGADQSYVSRLAQDAAILNTFVFLPWPYDEKFEHEICWAEYCRAGGKDNDAFKDTLNVFHYAREVSEEHKLNHIVSPRNIIQAVRLLAQGMTPAKIVDYTLYRALKDDQREKLREGIEQRRREAGIRRNPNINNLGANFNPFRDKL